MIEDIIKDAEGRMAKSTSMLGDELHKMRAGRAHAGLLDQVTVDYYGSSVPINQVAKISVVDARNITVTPWEKPMFAAVEKAIREADLGLNPVGSGDVIRVPLPPLTEERRKDMVRIVRAEGENGKVAIRNVRRDAIADLKELQREKEISEDDQSKGEARIQKLTDKFVAKVDDLVTQKEKDLMEV